VNRAGATIIDPNATADERDAALSVVNNWRACHGYPINTFQATLREKLKKVQGETLVAQRLKRLPSITQKLERNPGMQLARMQDIGGLRAIVPTMKSVRILVDSYEASRFKHELIRKYDYVQQPKSDGYRGVHLVYRYQNDSNPSYNGLLVEIQIRSEIQHSWATAVETVGIFLGQALKASEGDKDWLEFFEWASAGFSFLERTPRPEFAQGLSSREVVLELNQRYAQMNVVKRLAGFVVAANALDDDRAGDYNLVVLHSDEGRIEITAFSEDHLEQANAMYTGAEKRYAGDKTIQVVLVAAGTIKELRRAYPNYFADTGEFVKNIARIQNVVARRERRKHPHQPELL
jgi:hypothetical protein